VYQALWFHSRWGLSTHNAQADSHQGTVSFQRGRALVTAWPTGSCCRAAARETLPMTRWSIGPGPYGAGIGEVEQHPAPAASARCVDFAWPQCCRVAGEVFAMPSDRRIQADMGRSGVST
jgi:hypothetical protein